MMAGYFGEEARDMQMAAPQGQPVPELGRLKAAAESVAHATGRIEQFLQRFTGPVASDTRNGDDHPPQGYRDDLNSLFAQIDRLQGAVSALDHIG